MSTYDLEPGDKVISNTGELLTVKEVNGVMGKFTNDKGDEVELQLTKVKYLDNQEEAPRQHVAHRASDPKNEAAPVQKNEEPAETKAKPKKNNKKDN